MFIEDALKKILSDDADVYSLVGNRITPNSLEQITQWPAVAYRRVDEIREPVLGSPATAPPMIRVVFFSVVKKGNHTVNGETWTARRLASRVDKAIRVALLGYQGDVVIPELSPPESMLVQGIFFVRAADTYDESSESYQYGSVYDVHFSDTY